MSRVKTEGTLKNELRFANRSILILGLARQGLALARFFVAQGARVTISDAAPAEKLQAELAALGDLPVQLALGGHPLHLLDGCDLLCLSGGVPPQIPLVQEAVARGIRLSNDSLLTLQLAHSRGLGPLVAITGSSGKTTTTTLVGEMLAATGRTVHVGGNIGTPLIDRLDAIQPGEPVVLELSSFQLELFDPAVAFGPCQACGPHVAAILNVTPNHLDRHPNMASYASAKFNLLRRLPQGATAVLSSDDAVTAALLPTESRHAGPIPSAWRLGNLVQELQESLAGRGIRLVPFSRQAPLAQGAWLAGDLLLLEGQPICRRDEVRLRGDHNIANLLAAAAISAAAGASVDAIAAVARRFTGVPHRLEVVAEADGVTWINDSIATSPERAIAGLRSFDSQQQTLILLAGGKDKNLSWDTFAQEIVERVRFLIGFGEAGPMIVDLVQERARYSDHPAPACAVVQRLDEAVELAARTAGSGTVVLLSPGGTSFDAYKNFEARGEHFRHLVHRQLAARSMSGMKSVG